MPFIAPARSDDDDDDGGGINVRIPISVFPLLLLLLARRSVLIIRPPTLESRTTPAKFVLDKLRGYKSIGVYYTVCEILFRVMRTIISHATPLRPPTTNSNAINHALKAAAATERERERTIS